MGFGLFYRINEYSRNLVLSRISWFRKIEKQPEDVSSLRIYSSGIKSNFKFRILKEIIAFKLDCVFIFYANTIIIDTSDRIYSTVDG